MTQAMTAETATPQAMSRGPAFPEGWFQIAYSDDLAPGQVMKLHYFGQELVLFRTMSGRAQALDAYCAHLGAHLGVGGTVAGEHIRCPFHAWEYGVDGLCKAIPYSDRMPARGAQVRAWPTEERSGLILLWHSPADHPPRWDPPELTEYGDPAWTEYIIRQSYVIATTAHEIAENIVDLAHFPVVHGSPQAPGMDYTIDGHQLAVELSNQLPSLGYATRHVVTLYGLGLNINRSVGLGAKSFWTSYTPIDPDRVEVRFSMLAARSTANDPTGDISRQSAAATVLEFAKDIPIWENKIHRPIPLLSKDDGPIGRYRTWALQFF